MTTVETIYAASPTVIRILDAARDLFMQRGYSDVSITDISKAAGVTKPTLYYHFADKEAVYAGMALRLLDDMHDDMARRIAAQSTTCERLVALTSMIFAIPGGDTRLMRHEMFTHLGADHQRRLAQAFYARLFQPITRLMAEAVERGDLAAQPPEELTMFFLSMVEGFREFAGAEARERPAGPMSSMTISPERLVDLFLHGVAPR